MKEWGGVSSSNDGFLLDRWICTIRHSKKGRKGLELVGIGRDMVVAGRRHKEGEVDGTLYV